jgi:Transcriptional regulators
VLQRFETFTENIAAVYRCVQKIKSAEMTELGLRGGHVMCIFYLGRHPEGLTAAELCALCDEDKAAVSRSAGELEERGLVECLQSGGARRKYRAKLVLTADGRRVAESVERRVENAVACGGEGLTAQQRAAFYDALEKICKNLQAYCEEKSEEEQ